MEPLETHPGDLDVIASVPGRDDRKIARSGMYGMVGAEKHR